MLFLPQSELVLNPATIQSARVPADPAGPVDLVANLPYASPGPDGTVFLEILGAWRFRGDDAQVLREYFARQEWSTGHPPGRPVSTSPTPTPTPGANV